MTPDYQSQWIKSAQAQHKVSALTPNGILHGVCVGVRSVPSPAVRIRDAQGKEHEVPLALVRLEGTSTTA